MAVVCVCLSLSLTHISIFHIDSLITLISVHVSVFGFVVDVCMCKGWLSHVCVEGLALWFASLMWFGHEKSDGSPTVTRQTHTHTHLNKALPEELSRENIAWHLTQLCVCVASSFPFSRTQAYICTGLAAGLVVGTAMTQRKPPARRTSSQTRCCVTEIMYDTFTHSWSAPE